MSPLFLNSSDKLLCYVVIFSIFSGAFSFAFAEISVDEINVSSNSFRLFFNTPFTFETMIAQSDGVTLQLTESSESRKYNFFRNSSPVSYDVSLTSISDTQIDFTVDAAGLADKRLTVTGTQLSAVKLNNVLSNNWSFSGGVNTINVNSTSTVSLFFTSLPVSATTSSGGSGGGDKSKPLISNISNSIEGVEDLLDSKITLEVGQLTTISMIIRENQGIDNLEHVSLYLDTRQPDLSQDFKTTHIRWEKNNSLSINNPSGMLDAANIAITPVDAVNSKIDIEFSFAIPLESVYLHLVTWDLSRNQIQEDYPDAIQVIPSKTLQPESEIIPEYVEEPKIIPGYIEEPIFSWEVFNHWAGYSSEVTSDKEFLSHLGINGNEIPTWMKNQNAKWLKEGLISQQNLLDAINNLYERKIIQ